MAKQKQQQGNGLVAVLMLSDWAGWKAGSVAEIDAALASQLVVNGLADDNPEAVAFARKQNG